MITGKEVFTAKSTEQADLSGLVPHGESTGIIVQQQKQLQLLGQYVGQMANMLMALQKEVEAMKKDNALQITVNHQQAKQLAAAIRERAVQICEKYALDPKIHGSAIRTAVKKSVLVTIGVPDLHDVPLRDYGAVMVMICNWSNYSLIVKRRQMDADHG